MRMRLFMTIGACLALYGCNNNDAVNDQSAIISDSKITGSESRVVSAASSETSQIKAVEKNIKSDELKSKEEVFIFTGDSVTSSQNSSRYLKIGERLPVSELKKRYPGYKIWSSVGEDCLFCATVSNDIVNLGVDYDEKGIVVTSISCDTKACADALGHEVGSSLKAAIGESGNCDFGDWTVCYSPKINGLEYLVEFNQKCVFEPKLVEEKSQIPSCAKIAGFKVSMDGFYTSVAD